MKFVQQQFNSTRRINPGAYSKAAKNLTNAVNNLYETQRETAPDFSRLAQVQQNINTELAIEAIKAQRDITQAGLSTLGRLTARKEILKGEEALRKGKRAGKLMLYGGGAIMQGIKMASRKPIKKPEPIYGVETPFQVPNSSPYADALGRARGQLGEIGPAPVMPDSNDPSTWNTGLPQIPGVQQNSSDRILETPPAAFQQPPAEVRPQSTGQNQSPMSKSQYQKILLNNGWSPQHAGTMARIGMAESSGKYWDDTARSGTDPNKKHEFSVGAWQINTKAHMPKVKARGWGIEDLRDPNKNAQVALDVFNEAGGFTPWTTYTSGKYLNY